MSLQIKIGQQYVLYNIYTLHFKKFLFKIHRHGYKDYFYAYLNHIFDSVRDLIYCSLIQINYIEME